MNLKLEILTGEDCLFKIKDITTDYTTSDPEFRYLDTISIVVLARHSSSSPDVEYLEPLTYPHKDREEWWEIPTPFNAYFDFTYIVLPTVEYVKNNLNIVEFYSEIYCSDGKAVYKYSKENILEISAKELVESKSINTTISKVEDSLSSICSLKKYFIRLCNQIYEKRVFSKCSFKGCVDKELIHKRDLIWTIINLISYYTDKGQLWEVLRLIELIENCDNIFDLNNRVITNSCTSCQ